MVWRVLKRVYSQWFYVVLTITSAAFVFATLSWWPNLGLLKVFLFSSTIGIWDKLSFAYSLLGFYGSNGGLLALLSLLSLSILFGVNLSLFWFYIKKNQKLSRHDMKVKFASIGGFVGGVFGVGCVACGTFILSGLLHFFGLSWLLLYLPFHGVEFSFIGLFLMLASSYYMIKNIEKPVVCQV